MYALEAQKHGGSAEWLSTRHAMITHGEKKFMAYGYVAHESALGVTICADKVLTAKFLMTAGVQTPQTTPVGSADEAVEAAHRMATPVVVKPSDGKKSRGVTTDLTDEAAIRHAFNLAAQHGSRVLVQKYVRTHEEVRVMATPSSAVAVIKRVLPHVIGDGVSTLKQLIEDKNLQRELNPSLRKRSIPLDEETELHLRRQGYSLSDVPERERWVTVRNIAGLSAGADPHEAFDTTDEKIKNTAADAVASIPGLGWGGVDVIIEEGTGEPFVVEINTDAGYGQALFPTYGKSRNVAKMSWDARSQETPVAPTGPVRPVPAKDAAEPVLQQRSPGATSYSRARLTTAFTEYLEHSGYEHENLSPSVRRVASKDGASLLITRSLMTARDRSSATRVVNHHTMVRRLLSLHEVRQPRGKVITSLSDFHTFTRSLTQQVALTPPRTPWLGEGSEVVSATAAQDRKRIRAGTFVQAHRRGYRARILATQHTALAVVSRQSAHVSGAHLNSASEVAVSAVRAIPELRWAAVYVLVLKSGECLVEGLALNPRFTARDRVVAGDMDGFFSWLIEEGSDFAQ
jgi:D-alanine-D-alanine ligase-like ATP-grasp enzyme